MANDKTRKIKVINRKGDVSDDWACNEFKMYESI